MDEKKFHKWHYYVVLHLFFLFLAASGPRFDSRTLFSLMHGPAAVCEALKKNEKSPLATMVRGLFVSGRDPTCCQPGWPVRIRPGPCSRPWPDR